MQATRARCADLIMPKTGNNAKSLTIRSRSSYQHSAGGLRLLKMQAFLLFSFLFIPHANLGMHRCSITVRPRCNKVRYYEPARPERLRSAILQANLHHISFGEQISFFFKYLVRYVGNGATHGSNEEKMTSLNREHR